jgi:hypothetical protein
LRIDVNSGGGCHLYAQAHGYTGCWYRLYIRIDSKYPSFLTLVWAMAHLPTLSFSHSPMFFSFLSPLLKCSVSCFFFIFPPQYLEDSIVLLILTGQGPSFLISLIVALFLSFVKSSDLCILQELEHSVVDYCI